MSFIRLYAKLKSTTTKAMRKLRASALPPKKAFHFSMLKNNVTLNAHNLQLPARQRVKSQAK
jgi:hypothetical protein